jgi:hypothetical protein
MQNAIERDIAIEPEISKLTQMEKMLEGNKWMASKAENMPREFDPFAGLDDEIKPKPLTKNLNELF